MSTEVELVEHLDEVNKVVAEYLKGNDPTKISKDLNNFSLEIGISSANVTPDNGNDNGAKFS